MDCHVAGAPRNDDTGADAPRDDGVGLVIASEARQSTKSGDMDCHVAGAPRNDGVGLVIASEARQSMTSEGMDRHGLRPRDDGVGCHCERSAAIHLPQPQTPPDPPN